MGNVLALDIGGRRIGVALSDESLRIPHPLTTVIVDGSEMEKLRALVDEMEPVNIVVGFPRNQAGEVTEQTKIVEGFAEKLKELGAPITFQDESLTSVIAEQQLRDLGRPYTKEMIDSAAATIILQDYLEEKYGH